MSISEYRRVSRRRVCLICGKPDWCSYTPDEHISFCARMTQNADRLSRTGWGVYYQTDLLLSGRTLPSPPITPKEKPKIAPLAIRDFVYRKLTELSPAIRSDEIINGEKGLIKRNILDFENYGALPQSNRERQKLVKQICAIATKRFPNFRRQKTFMVSRVPGFWVDKYGQTRFWTTKDYVSPLILVPYRNPKGLIQACQIRFMRENAKNSTKYIWLSTPKRNGSVSCGSPLHFTDGFQDQSLSESPIIVTEGALKANTIQNFLPEFRVIAIGGVNSSHAEVILNTRNCQLFIAFDADYRHNPHVAGAISRLIGFRLGDAKIHNYDSKLKILVWPPEIKGLDDALIEKAPIHCISPGNWLDILNSRNKRRVNC